MDTLLQDLRYAARQIARSPGFTLLVVAVLGLGVGANTALFTLADAMLFRSRPGVQDAERLVWVSAFREGHPNPVSYPDYRDVRDRVGAFSGVAAFHDVEVSVSGGGEPERTRGQVVSGNYFSVLGAPMALGRGFVPPEDSVPGAYPVAVVGHDFWRRRLGADPGVVGSRIVVDGTPFTVVGVAAAGFNGADHDLERDVWIPLAMIARAHPEHPGLLEERSSWWLSVVARLRPGVSARQADAALAVVAAQIARADPAGHRDVSLRTYPAASGLAAGALPNVLAVAAMALAVTGLVLLVACANVSSFLLGRAVARRREIAIRLSLGAARGRVVRQLLTESTMVALLGGALGVLFAFWGLDLILASFPFQPPLWMTFDIDRNVLLFTLALSLATGVLFGLVPAFRATSDVHSTLKEGGRGVTAGARQGRLRGSLVVAELALAMVLLVGAMLMVRSFLRLQGADPGFDTTHVLTLRVITGGGRYEQDGVRNTLFREVVERVGALPGVQGAATVSYLPLSGISATSGFQVEGVPAAPGDRNGAEYRGISPDYFRVMGIRVLRGRGLTADEVERAAPVVVVNRTLAERFWPGRDPVGRRISFAGPWVTVVGVAEDVRLATLNEKPYPQVYAPYTDRAPAAMTLMVRTAGDPAAATAAVRRAIRGIDPSVVADEALAMDEVVHRSVWQQRLFGGLFTSFAAIALLLAVTGVYGVIAYSVSQRTHEIGVRMALGARPERIVRMVVGQGATLAAIGVGIGLVGAFAVTRVLGSLLYGVSPTDPVAFAGTTLLLAGAALAASWIPARRAVRVDPMVALRQD